MFTLYEHVLYIKPNKNANAIGEYIRNQLQEDIDTDQISLKRVYGPVHG